VKLGAFLRAAREKAGIGLRELAGRLDLSPTHVSRIERDDGTSPSRDTLVRWAEAIGGDPDEALRLGGMVPEDVERWLLAKPGRFAAVRKLG
jgi:transcriptional regulator with XRE-family HTH domain